MRQLALGLAFSLAATLGLMVACLLVIRWIFATGWRLKA